MASGPDAVRIPVTLHGNTCANRLEFHIKLVPVRGGSILPPPDCADYECWPGATLTHESAGHVWSLSYPRFELLSADTHEIPVNFFIKQDGVDTTLRRGQLPIRFDSR